MHISLLYNGSLLSMRVNGQAGKSQSPSTGLRQSCPLGATLIGIFFHGLHHLQLMPAPARLQFRHVQICKLICIELALVVCCATLRMTVNVAKTQGMVVCKPSARSLAL